MGISVQQLFYGAYRDAGLVPLAQMGLGPDQTEEARQVYNRMTDAWNANGLTISHVGRFKFDIIPDKGDYTIGPSGDWDYPSFPRQVDRASMLVPANTGQAEYEMWPMTIDEWQSWTLKEQSADWPRRFYYERPSSRPTGNEGALLGIMHLLYIPTGANQVALYLEEKLSKIESVADQEIEYLDGYQEAIETNLAVRIAARHPREAVISEDTRRLAKESLRLVENSNNRPLLKTTDLASRRGRSNVYEGNRYGNPG